MDDFLYGLGQGMQGFWNAYQGAKTAAEDKAFKNKQLELQEAARKAEIDKALRDQAKEQEKQKFEQDKFTYQKNKDAQTQALEEKKFGLLLNKNNKESQPPMEKIAFDVEKEKQVQSMKDDMKRQAAQTKLEVALKQLEDPNRSDDEKVSIGEGILKMLNDPENPDVVGAEEAARIGAYLKPFSLSRAGSTFGRDIDRFIRQVRNKKEAVEMTRQSLQSGGTPMIRQNQAAPIAMPKIGEVVSGHRYKGGDPKLPTSWEK